MRLDRDVEHGAGVAALGELPEIEPRHDLAHRAHRVDAPGRDQHHRIGEPGDLVERVGDIDDGNREGAADVFDEGEDFAAALVVEAGQGLVHQEQSWARQQGTADGDALGLAAR